MLPVFKLGLANQGIVLQTTLINTYWALKKERERELTKGADPMFGVTMKTYIRDVDKKKKSERRC